MADYFTKCWLNSNSVGAPRQILQSPAWRAHNFSLPFPAAEARRHALARPSTSISKMAAPRFHARGACTLQARNPGDEGCGKKSIEKSSACHTVYLYYPFATPSPAYAVLYSFNSGVTAAGGTPAASPTPSSCVVPTPAPSSSMATATPTPMPTVILPCSTCTGAVAHGRPIVVNNGAQDVLFGITRQGGIGTNGNSSGNGVIYA